MHDDIRRILRVREHRVRLNQLLRKPIVQPLQQKASQPTPRPARNRMQHHKPLQRITPIRLAINHIHNLLLNLRAHAIPSRPVVARTRALLVNVHVLRVVDVLEGPVLDPVDDARFEVEQDGARDVARVVRLVEEDVFAVAAFGREVFEVAVLVYAVLTA